MSFSKGWWVGTHSPSSSIPTELERLTPTWSIQKNSKSTMSASINAKATSAAPSAPEQDRDLRLRCKAHLELNTTMSCPFMDFGIAIAETAENDSRDYGAIIAMRKP